MAFGNAKHILKNTSGLSAFKLLLLTAQQSRPGIRPLCMLLLRSFVHKDEILIRYKQANRSFKVFLRMADRESDMHSMLEVVVRNVYPLDPAYAADLVIDGGANVGLFSLQAAAVYPSATIVACEPLPRNIAQTERHLTSNQVNAEILPVCIGGSHRTVSFYCRGANSSSFDSAKPYDRILEIDVLRLRDVLSERPAQRILIKLDIEGMEIEALENFIPGERRAILILGELHGHRQHRTAIERLFAEEGWSIQFGDLSGEDAMFEARSPAAAALGQSSAAGILESHASLS
jgi:FkbM family methyltransferase